MQGSTQTILQNSSKMNNQTNNSIVNNNEKYSEQEYSNYIDQSDVVIQTYKNSSAIGLEKYFLKIEEWLDRPIANQEDNKPFVIEAEEGVGKKSLLVKWMEYHQTKKKRYPDIILSHFASAGGNNANYFFAIYRILNKLREALDIQQKVELLEEKLRKYFSYWLNHCSDKLEKQLKYGEKVNYDKVIIIIEGIDLFIDQQYNKEANVAFWMPKFFPEHIKIIVTCQKTSQANLYLRSIGCEVTNMSVDFSIVQSMVERHSKRPLFINEKIRTTHLEILNSYEQKDKNQGFYKVFLCCLLPYPTEGVITAEEIAPGTFEKIYESLDYEALKKVENDKQLMEYILELYSNHLMTKDKFVKLLTLFTLTQKGLTIEEVINVTNVSDEEWKLFISCFKVYILNFKGLWIMNNDSMKKVVIEKFNVESSFITELHQEIAETLGKITPNSIRKLEEQTYHLFKSKDHFKLKEIISAIENFLLLFNPNNKYDLCRYWQNLEEQGFDPVIEYNKAIEGFEMHYHPSSQDVFRIIVQISRFLKEFSDFETYFTPEFRHPPVKGTYQELDDIGLLRELLGLSIFQPTEAEENEKPDLDKFARNPEEKIQEKKEKMKTRNKKESSLKKKEKDEDAYGIQAVQQKQMLTKEERKEKRAKRMTILSEVEQLNVDIPSNKEQFRRHYENQIKEIMKQNNQNQSDETGDENLGDPSLTDEEDEERRSLKSEGGQSSFLDKDKGGAKKKKQPEIISISQLRESYNQKEKLPTNYYYKRWLWVQFPWACLSLKCDYSAKLKECFSSPIEYMSIKKEKEFTKQALKIAIEAKLKKQMMYKKTNMSDSQSIIKPVDQPDSILIKSSQSYGTLPALEGNKKNLNFHVPSGFNSTRNLISKVKVSNGLSPFYITAEYLNQNNLNRQLNQTLKSDPQNTSLNQQSKLNQSVEVQNTTKVLEKSKVSKDKTKLYDPISSIQDSSNLTTVLPRLKGSINQHSVKELDLLEQQALDMNKEHDQLVHINNGLAKNLKQLKVAEHNQLKYHINPERIENTQSKVMELEGQISETEENYLLGQMQIERLRSILKICEDNKQQNEDWIRNLNFLLNSFKKMIRSEQEDIKTVKSECSQLQKINREYVHAFQDKMEAQKDLIQSINSSVKGKEKFDFRFNKTDETIEQSAINQIEKMKLDQKGLDNRKKMKDKQNQLEKNSKQISEQLEKAEAQYQKLKQVIDISDENYSQNEKFQSLLASREKKDDLTAIVLQRDNIIAELKQKLQERQNYLKIVMKAFPQYAKENSSDIDSAREEKKQSSENGIHQEITQKQEVAPNQEVKRALEGAPSQEVAPTQEVSEQEGETLKNNQQVELDFESKSRQYQKLQQMRLSAFMAISTIQKKLQLDQSQDMSGSYEFEEDSIIANLNEKIAVIKEKVSEQEYETFQAGKFDFSKMYKQLVSNRGTSNSDQQEEPLSQKEA